MFKSIMGGAADTQAQKSQDMLDLMLGNVDDLERISSNVTKAQVALELLVNTRNVALEAYNEIIKMSI
ncbi:MAG: flagellar hook-basal body complex protein FliE [Oscillospiraceae bacterium]|nr:flagellar hook-basal body complex protein FliE [Oscillospiraceae bacterium]